MDEQQKALSQYGRNSRKRFAEFVRRFRKGELGDPKDARKKDDDSANRAKEADGRDEQPEKSEAAGKREAAGKKSRKGPQYLRAYYRYLRPYRRSVLVLVVLSLVIAALDMVQPLFIRYIVDKILLNDAISKSDSYSLLHTIGMVMVAVIIASQGLGIWRNYQQRLLNVQVILSLRRQLFDRMLRLSLDKLTDLKTGGIISRLTDDVNTTTGLLQMAAITPGVALVRLISALVILFFLNWQLALTAMGIIPCVMAVSFIAARRIRPIYRSIRREVSSVDGRVGEAFQGIRAVRAFGGEHREEREYSVGHHTMTRMKMFAHRRELILWSSWSLLLACISLVIVWVGGYMQLNDRATVGDIMAFQFYSFLLLQPVWQIVESFSELQRSLAAMERVFEVLNTDEDKPDAEAAIDADPFVETIDFDHVSFAYDQDDVIKDFDLRVEGGKTIALVGRSGAGKTTITDLVARFYDPTEGAIRLNGTDLRDLKKKSYRALLGVVQQEVFLFDGSIRENLLYGRPESDESSMLDAARRAHVDEFVDKLPAGYDSIIGERGVKLSGGQRQRLSIARAILADPKILILDEATSNLDTESEQWIQDSLSDLLQGRTTFVIAHRLSTIRNADLIVVLDEGQIIEQGTHEQLMEQSGTYREMVLRQHTEVG